MSQENERHYWIPVHQFESWPFQNVVCLNWWPVLVTDENRTFGDDRPGDPARFRAVPERHLMLVNPIFVARAYTPVYASDEFQQVALSPLGWAAYRQQILAVVERAGVDPAKYERRIAARYVTIRIATIEAIEQARIAHKHVLHLLHDQAALDLYAIRTDTPVEIPE